MSHLVSAGQGAVAVSFVLHAIFPSQPGPGTDLGGPVGKVQSHPGERPGWMDWVLELRKRETEFLNDI